MSRSGAARPADEGAGLYETMLAHSTEPRWYVLSSGLVSPTMAHPDREQMIEDYMRVAIYTPTRLGSGHSSWGEPHWPTRDEAEHAVDQAMRGRELAA